MLAGALVLCSGQQSSRSSAGSASSYAGLLESRASDHKRDRASRWMLTTKGSALANTAQRACRKCLAPVEPNTRERHTCFCRRCVADNFAREAAREAHEAESHLRESQRHTARANDLRARAEAVRNDSRGSEADGRGRAHVEKVPYYSSGLERTGASLKRLTMPWPPWSIEWQWRRCVSLSLGMAN
jgi:hypothetical protein